MYHLVLRILSMVILSTFKLKTESQIYNYYYKFIPYKPISFSLPLSQSKEIFFRHKSDNSSGECPAQETSPSLSLITLPHLRPPLNLWVIC